MSWQDAEPWQPEPVVAAPARDPLAWEPYAKIDALRALGVLKDGEKPVTLHCHRCAFPRDYGAACTCPGGPEIIWPDHDELKPQRFYTTPERFYDKH